MYCEQSGPRGATITKPPTSLAALPSASEVDFGGRPPWAVIPTSLLTKTLRLDRGLFATWRCRGIGPAELPASWFRPASGRPNYFVISDVMAWLAARRAEPFDRRAAWMAALAAAGLPQDPVWLRRFVERAGPVQGDVTFTATGWREYLSSLGSPA